MKKATFVAFFIWAHEQNYAYFRSNFWCKRNLARFRKHAHFYWQSARGKWIPHPTVVLNLVTSLFGTTATGDYQDFAKIGVAALMMVAQNNNIDITEEQALEAIKTLLLSLPAHPDVKSSLVALKAQGYRIVCLTNSSNKGVKTQFANAGLSDYVDKRMSFECIKKAASSRSGFIICTLLRLNARSHVNQ